MRRSLESWGAVPLGIVVALSAIESTSSRADPSPRPDRTDHEISAGYAYIQYLLPLSGYPTTSNAIELRYRRAFDAAGLEASGGARVGYKSEKRAGAVAELFCALAAVADFGSWRPTAALEMGYSTAGTRADDPGTARELVMDPHPVYVQSVAAPLRFRAGRLEIELLSIGVGTSLAEPGHAVRLELRGVQVGWAF